MDEHKQLLKELSRELQMAGELDPDTQKLLAKINADLETGVYEKTVERVKLLESRFAAKYPTSERIAQVLVDSLGKMGI